MSDKNSLLEFPTDETKEKVQWTKGHDFMDGTPRYTFEGRDPATTYERFQVVIYTEWEHRYYAVGGQLCRYPKFMPEDYVLLKLTPSHAKDNWYRWDQEIPPGSPKELAWAAREFSLLKIGYRGDMAFRNAEVIDVPLFLTDGITQGEPVQTTSELRELLFEHVEREQREYTDSLYRMTQGQLIANAGEIEANRFCYNALLTMRLDREQLKVLAAMDDPLEAVRGVWASAQEVGQEEEFSHTLFEICGQTAQEQTMRMK